MINVCLGKDFYLKSIHYELLLFSVDIKVKAGTESTILRDRVQEALLEDSDSDVSEDQIALMTDYNYYSADALSKNITLTLYFKRMLLIGTPHILFHWLCLEALGPKLLETFVFMPWRKWVCSFPSETGRIKSIVKMSNLISVSLLTSQVSQTIFLGKTCFFGCIISFECLK